MLKRFILISAVLTFSGCDAGNTPAITDTTPPSEVAALEAEGLNNFVELTWTDPQDPDFKEAEVIFGANSWKIPKGQQILRLYPFTLGESYSFTVKDRKSVV